MDIPQGYIETPLRQLIESTLKIQDIDFISKEMDRCFLASVKEYCTVKICGPRRAGHTMAIARCAEMFKNPAVIVYTGDHVKNFLDSYASESLKKKVNCYTHYTFETKLRGGEFDAIFVDVSSIMSQKKKDALNELASIFLMQAKNRGEKFILVYVE